MKIGGSSLRSCFTDKKQITYQQNFKEGKIVKQYKVVAGPSGLVVNHGDSADSAVKQFQVIIEREAVDGWEFYCVEPISVRENPPEPIPAGCWQSILISLKIIAPLPIPEPRNYSINMLIFVKGNR
jgi:hypothetical protein